VNITLLEAPISGAMASELMALSEAVFANEAPDQWIEGFRWRLTAMPDLTVFMARVEDAWAGFKIGYAESHLRYYSWLGGVHPDYRKRGVARNLMNAQHDWLAASRFQTAETKVSQNNDAMIALNLSCGMKEVGQFLKDGEPYLILKKEFSG